MDSQEGKNMKVKRMFVQILILLLSGVVGFVVLQPAALAADKIVQFNNPGCQ